MGRSTSVSGIRTWGKVRVYEYFLSWKWGISVQVVGNQASGCGYFVEFAGVPAQRPPVQIQSRPPPPRLPPPCRGSTRRPPPDVSGLNSGR
jgi:hypothetical protein